MNYQVHVGNIGCVYQGCDKRKARAAFREYASQSRTNYGRAAGESVTLFEDGTPVMEHWGIQRD